MRNYLLLIGVLLFTNASAQNYQKDYFIAPLDTPIFIVGTFGEIRPDHFHTGIDIGTNEQEGLPVMAAADGYVSRIKISADGYGKALYITHPNGYVTVYGHLQKFNIQINAYIRAIQYQRQSFEVDVNLKDKEIKVKKRDVIGYSGGTGGADGPHLHFEIRDEKTEEPINPMLFGIQARDHMPPQIRYVRIFPSPENGILNKTDTATTYEIQTVEGINMLNIPDYPLAFGNIAFGIDVVDHNDDTNAELGIYSVELYVDQQLAYQWQFDRLKFTDARYANAHIDYMAKVRDRINIQRAFRLAGNHLNIYPDTTASGYQFFGEDISHDIRFVAKDFAGNSSKIDFQVITYASLANNAYQPRPADAILITQQKGIAIHKPRLDVSIPAGAIFEDLYYTDAESKTSPYVSNIFKVGHYYEAVNTPITIGIKPNSELPDSLKSKAVIAQLYTSNAMKSWGGEWNGKFLTAKVKSFGDFLITLDTIPPVVEKEYVPADLSTAYGPIVKIRVSDNLSGIKSYSAKIDGRWWLFEYDKKNNMLIADVSSVDSNHEHPMEITVTDERGNVTVWKSSFYW